MEDDVDEILENGDATKMALEKVKRKLSVSQKERQEYLDGWQRARADYANLLKKQGEIETLASRKSVTTVIEHLLPVLDSFEHVRALAQDDTLGIGIQQIDSQLATSLEGLGITRICEVGVPFDPAIHECVENTPTNKKANDEVVARVLSTGYRCNNHIIRPAKVALFTYSSNK